jgi:hypothetical protein
MLFTAFEKTGAVFNKLPNDIERTSKSFGFSAPFPNFAFRIAHLAALAQELCSD